MTSDIFGMQELSAAPTPAIYSLEIGLPLDEAQSIADIGHLGAFTPLMPQWFY